MTRSALLGLLPSVRRCLVTTVTENEQGTMTRVTVHEYAAALRPLSDGRRRQKNDADQRG
jgi:hypothetical protein